MRDRRIDAMRGRVTRIPCGVLVLAGSLSACNFDGVALSGFEMNACMTDAECAEGTHCEGGMCVARNVDEPLAVTLEVTPTGTDTAPSLLDRFLVEGSVARDWELPVPVGVSGRIHEGAKALSAEVRFVPADGVSGVTASAIVTSTEDANPAGSFVANLMMGRTYLMEVQPIARELPPVREEVDVGAAEEIDVDYAALALDERTFIVRGGPALGETLLVRAFDRDGGQPVSSTAPVVDGEATLVLSPDAGSFRLEVSVEEQYADVMERAAPSKDCDVGASAYPVFSIDEGEAGDGDVVELPPYPERIQYSGTVELCEGATEQASEVGSLPITLRSTEILIDDAGAAFRGTFGATTTAHLSAGQLRFCVEVVPGTYEVVVTPPSSMECAIFAETRLVQAPDGMAATGILLTLPAPAYLSGVLQTVDGTPVAGATIEAQALGRSEGVQLAGDDPSVVQYNRSKQTTSDEDGGFELPVDLGGYDVVVKPPAESGFPWRVLHDVNIGARDFDFWSRINVVSPVRIDGTLRYAGKAAPARSTLEGAEVRAYAVIPDAFDTERAVPVGKAVADGEGRFTLLLAPSTHEGW